MRIAEFLRPEDVIAELQASAKADVFKELAEQLNRANPAISQARYQQVLEDREKLGSTGMEKGVAIPHARLAELTGLVACFGVSHAGIDFQSRDGKPAQFIFALVAPEHSAGLHLKALSRLSRVFRSESLKERFLQSRTSAEIHALLVAEDAAGG